MTDDTDTCVSQRHDSEVSATTTVTFPRAESDRVNSYCDGCIRHLLLFGVRFEGVNDHA